MKEFHRIFSLKINYLVGGTVIKALPDRQSYLVQIGESEVLGILPKRYASREYKVGDFLVAAVFQKKGGWIILSQRSPAYVRKVLEGFLAPLIREGRVKIKRVATVEGADFFKVAAESPTGEDPVELCAPYIKDSDVKSYITKTIVIIPFSRDPEEYIVNALYPGPREKIRRVIIQEDMKKASVLVESRSAGLFFGRKGVNVAAAAKLTGYEINIIPV